jgi:hypothetical protein
MLRDRSVDVEEKIRPVVRKRHRFRGQIHLRSKRGPCMRFDVVFASQDADRNVIEGQRKTDGNMSIGDVEPRVIFSVPGYLPFSRSATFSQGNGPSWHFFQCQFTLR